jgi:hypothetical protein
VENELIFAMPSIDALIEPLLGEKRRKAAHPAAMGAVVAK